MGRAAGGVDYGAVVMVVYPVRDVESAIAWYQDTLGFTAQCINRPEGAPTNDDLLTRDDVTVHLVLRGEVVEGESQDFQHAGPADAVFTTSDVDEMFKEVAAKGVRLFQQLKNQSWGQRDFAILDPDGNKIWISQALKQQSSAERVTG